MNSWGLLPLLPECWEYRCVPPHLASSIFPSYQISWWFSFLVVSSPILCSSGLVYLFLFLYVHCSAAQAGAGMDIHVRVTGFDWKGILCALLTCTSALHLRFAVPCQLPLWWSWGPWSFRSLSSCHKPGACSNYWFNQIELNLYSWCCLIESQWIKQMTSEGFMSSN